MTQPKPHIDQGTASAKGVRSYQVRARGAAGEQPLGTDLIAEEVAVAMVYNGISHAVMMATPLNLEDFALGFSLTEGIVNEPSALRSIEVVESELGIEIQIDIASSVFMQLKQRRRQLSGRTGCGICGMESLEAVMPSVQPVPAAELPSFTAIERATQQMLGRQSLHAQCGAVHAAAWVNMAGDVQFLREDVGRHNALDKLIGGLVKGEQGEGFVLVSSRASYEMVAKLASRGMTTLVSVSAPTSLAIDLAEKANLNLIGFVRPGRQQIYCSQNN